MPSVPHQHAWVSVQGRGALRARASGRLIETELKQERGVAVDHTTIFRWVQRSAPELDKRCRPYLKATNDSYRIDETYSKVKWPFHRWRPPSSQ
jgi:IS6 family transposase